MKTTFGFCVCCAPAGVPATVTAATEANKPSQVRLVILIAVLPVRGQKQVTPKGALCPLSGVRREKAALSSGCKSHPATAPAGSNRSSHGGNEVAEAFG
jgi:hypothetical protein